MALVGGVAKYILACRQHTDLTPTSVVPKSRTLKQSVGLEHLDQAGPCPQGQKVCLGPPWDHARALARQLMLTLIF